MLYMYMYIHLYRFFKKLYKTVVSRSHLPQIFNKKKSLFFKKKSRLRVLISKRLTIALRKRKSKKIIRYRRYKHITKGNFFFKKFFFKTLLRSRKYLRYFFFLNAKSRQKKISKNISKNKDLNYFNTCAYEYSALNIVLRSHFCLFITDAFFFFKHNFFFLNGSFLKDPNTILNEFDCLQFRLSIPIYKYIISSKRFLKKKIALYRYNSWKFFKQKFLKLKRRLKPKKRRSPKFIYLLFLFKINTPRFLEIDYVSLSIFFLKKSNLLSSPSYYLNKLFSFKLFPLYNFKKIN